MILNVVNQPADPVATMRALMEDNHEDERGRRAPLRAGPGARGRARRRRRPGVAARARRRRAARCGWPSSCRRTSRSTSRWRRSRSSRSSCSTRSPSTYALDVLSVVEAILDDPFPVLMAQAHKERGEAVAEMKAEGIEYDERMELLEEVTYPEPLGEPLQRRAARLPRDAPVGARVRPVAEVGRARHVRVGPHVHRVRRALRPGALRGPRAALPQQRLPGAAPDGARAAQDRRARRDHRVARGDGPPDRLEPAGRVGGPDRPGVRRARGGGHRGRRGAAAAAADHRQRARVHRDGPQRDVPEGRARRARPLSTCWPSSRPPRPRSPTPPAQGHDEGRRLGSRARRLLGRARVDGHRAARALAAAADDRPRPCRARERAHAGRCARSSTTPKATTTSRSWRRSTSTPPTRPASR